MKYSVFGCGHKDWPETLHCLPKLIHSALEERGAERIYGFGASNVSRGTVLNDFAEWQEGLFKVLQRSTENSAEDLDTSLEEQAKIPN